MPREVFISYARSDNAREGDAPGWVTHFHARLKERLQSISGRPVSIYFDEVNHPEGTPLSEITRVEVRGARVLVCVLTSAFADPNRVWCRDEVLTYLDGRENPIVVHAVKIPPRAEETERLPEGIRHIPPVDFWKPGGRRNYPLEFARDSEDYRIAVNDVAHEILSRLPPPGPAPTRAPVYLARTAPDLHPSRVELERELMDRGYAVRPQDLLSDTAELVERRVRQALDDSVLSIHLLGREPGPVPASAPTVSIEGVNLSEALLAQQWRLDRDSPSARPRIVWFPQGMVAEDAGQVALIKSVERNPGAAMLVRGTMADVKASIRRALDGLAPPALPAPVAAATGDPRPPSGSSPSSSRACVSSATSGSRISSVATRSARSAGRPFRS